MLLAARFLLFASLERDRREQEANSEQQEAKKWNHFFKIRIEHRF